MPRHKKIFLVTGSTGSGHVLAARAIEEALKEESPGIKTQLIDAYDFISPFKRFAYRRLYQLSITVFPRAYTFGRNIITRKSPSAETFFKKGFLKAAAKMEDFFKKEKPDAVITTHAVAAGIVTNLKKNQKFNFAEAWTDFAFHRFQIYENIDYYYLPLEEIKKDILEKGFSKKEKIEVTGVPIRPIFERSLDKEKILKEFGLKKKRLTVLLTKGSFGWDPMNKTYGLAKELAKSSLPIQVIFVAARNKRLFENLKKINFPFPSLVLGFTDKMPELMEIADIQIGKTGGLMVAESLAKGLPFVIYDALPGQEEDNAQFLERKGVGVRMVRPKEVVKYLDSLIKHPTELKELQKKTLDLSRPDSSRKIARHVLEKL